QPDQQQAHAAARQRDQRRERLPVDVRALEVGGGHGEVHGICVVITGWVGNSVLTVASDRRRPNWGKKARARITSTIGATAATSGSASSRESTPGLTRLCIDPISTRRA